MCLGERERERGRHASRRLTLSKDMARMVRIEPWATTNSTKGTTLPGREKERVSDMN